jgi:hypothetical protein
VRATATACGAGPNAPRHSSYRRLIESKPCVLNKNPRTTVLSSLTSKQASVIQLADHGLTETEITEQLGAPVGVVRGEYAPPPLPVEAAARRPRIYLAGFDVFRPDALAHGETLKALCRAFGFEGLYPLDGAVPSITDPGDVHAGSMRPTSERYAKRISSWPISTIFAARASPIPVPPSRSASRWPSANPCGCTRWIVAS